MVFHNLAEGWRLMSQNAQTWRIVKMNWLSFALFWIHVIFAVTSLFINLLVLISQNQYILTLTLYRRIRKSKFEDWSTPCLHMKEIIWRHSTGCTELREKCELSGEKEPWLALGKDAWKRTCWNIGSNSLLSSQKWIFALIGAAQ